VNAYVSHELGHNSLHVVGRSRTRDREDLKISVDNLGPDDSCTPRASSHHSNDLWLPRMRSMCGKAGGGR
jgi:hypothetical protein